MQNIHQSMTTFLGMSLVFFVLLCKPSFHIQIKTKSNQKYDLKKSYIVTSLILILYLTNKL